MSKATLPDMKPYFLRALYEWCTDNDFTPHLSVQVDNGVRVPMQYVQDGTIVLNISPQATTQLHMGNELIEFSARFSGKLFKIEVPVNNVLAIYAKENSQGMAWPFVPAAPAEEPAKVAATTSTAEVPGSELKKSKGFLSVVK